MWRSGGRSAANATSEPPAGEGRRRDLIAGLCVAGLLLPEAVAYAGIAGLPPQRAIFAAIAGCLAGGASIEDAVRDAQDYTWQTLANGFRPGMGQFIPDRFFWARGDDNDTAEKEDGRDDR